MKDPSNRLKYIVTCSAVVLGLAHLIFPTVQIDAVTLGLLVLAILPWLSPLIKSVELPGVGKIELQDIRAAGEKVTQGEPIQDLLPQQDTYSFLSVAEQDPNLALVGLRIEIEKRLRSLAERNGIPSSRPMSRLADELSERGILKPNAASGLKDLIVAGNQAAHGVRVDFNVASWAIDYGPRILRLLDKKI